MAQQPIYNAKEEQRLMTELWSPDIADDPEAFVLFCYPWGKKNTPLANRTGPRKWQREILQELRDHIKKNNGKLDQNFFEALKDATCSGRGIGKSALVSWLSHWNASCHIGSTTRISANSENQLRYVTWAEMGKWLAMAINKHWFEMSATKITPAKWLSDLVERDLKKGTRYWAIEGVLWSEENPDGFAGPHNEDGMMIIFDEASGIADGIRDVAAGFSQSQFCTGIGLHFPMDEGIRGISTSASTRNEIFGELGMLMLGQLRIPIPLFISKLLTNTAQTPARPR